MTNQDPYRDRITDPAPGPAYTTPAADRGWGSGSIIGALVVLAIVIAAIVYGVNSSGTHTATGPSTTSSAPSTTGQGGAGGVAPPAGTAR